MRLAEFISQHHKEIIEEWVAFARGLTPATSGMSEPELRDHADRLLSAISKDMAAPQTDHEQAEKSKGRGDERGLELVGEKHAFQRIQSGFQLDQLVAEYRALRASVLRLWLKSGGSDGADMMRFNEAIDEALTEATMHYTEMVSRTREQFLAMLGHDLRNPLGAILMSAKSLSRLEGFDDRHLRATTRIMHSTERMNRMVDDLLDLTRTRLGSGIPITIAPVDLNDVCRHVIAEVEAFHPDTQLVFEPSGDLRGTWDGDRLAQVVSNLVANAVQHGSPKSPVKIIAEGRRNEVMLRVQNVGTPIPTEAIATVFEPLVRLQTGAAQHSTSMGLGLFIAREVVIAHGGTIEVASTAKDGTSLTVHLPRGAASVTGPAAPK